MITVCTVELAPHKLPTAIVDMNTGWSATSEPETLLYLCCPSLYGSLSPPDQDTAYTPERRVSG